MEERVRLEAYIRMCDEHIVKYNACLASHPEWDEYDPACSLTEKHVKEAQSQQRAAEESLRKMEVEYSQHEKSDRGEAEQFRTKMVQQRDALRTSIHNVTERIKWLAQQQRQGFHQQQQLILHQLIAERRPLLDQGEKWDQYVLQQQQQWEKNKATMSDVYSVLFSLGHANLQRCQDHTRSVTQQQDPSLVMKRGIKLYEQQKADCQKRLAQMK